MNYNILRYLPLLTLLLVGCQKSDDATFESDIPVAITTSSSTRTSSAFDGAELSLDIFYADDDKYNTSSKWSKSGSSWTPSTSPLWKNRTDVASVRAFAPAIEPIAGSIEYSVELDQSTEAALAASQLYAFHSSFTPTEANNYTVAIDFTRKMSMVELIFNSTNTVSNVSIVDINVKITCEVVDGSSITTPNDESIIPFKIEDNKYSFVLPPQSIIAGDTYITYSTEFQTYSIKAEEEIVFESGKVHTITIN